MTILHPIYNDDDLGDLTLAERRDLARHIHTLLQTDHDVKTLIRNKTAVLFAKLKRKKKKKA
jgi:hypothetical protein